MITGSWLCSRAYVWEMREIEIEAFGSMVCLFGQLAADLCENRENVYGLLMYMWGKIRGKQK